MAGCLNSMPASIKAELVKRGVAAARLDADGQGENTPRVA